VARRFEVGADGTVLRTIETTLATNTLGKRTADDAVSARQHRLDALGATDAVSSRKVSCPF
jgi:hypothetical protein